MANSPVMTVEVLRYNPENDQEPHLSSYQVPYDNQTSLLDALGYIKDNLNRLFLIAGLAVWRSAVLVG